MAIFAVVALIGVQVIGQAVRADARLAKVNEQAADTAFALALLRADLTAAIGLPFYPPNGLPLPALEAPARENRFALSLGGQATFDRSGPGRARATWRLDPATGEVTRQVWPSLIPGDVRMASPEVVLFRDVRALTVEGYDPENGWTPGYPKPGKDPDLLPDALRVTLETGGAGPLQVLVTLK